MSAANESTPRSARFRGVALALAAVVGIAVGFFAMRGSTSHGYAYAILHPVGFGAMCLLGLRGGKRPRSISPLLLLVLFLLDIARSPHLPVVSALGLVAGAIAVLAALRGNQRWVVAGVVTCSALLAATLGGGVWKTTRVETKAQRANAGAVVAAQRSGLSDPAKLVGAAG